MLYHVHLYVLRHIVSVQYIFVPFKKHMNESASISTLFFFLGLAELCWHHGSQSPGSCSMVRTSVSIPFSLRNWEIPQADSWCWIFLQLSYWRLVVREYLVLLGLRKKRKIKRSSHMFRFAFRRKICYILYVKCILNGKY